jgi:hypothetical protein
MLLDELTLKVNLMPNYNLAIVGGCGSSGTTLLAHLLSKHPAIGSGPEFNCFNHYEIYDFPLFKKCYQKMYSGKCMPWGYIDIHVFMTYREEYGIELESLEEWVAKSNNTDEFFEKLCSHMNNRFQTEFFLEKSPTNVYSFRILSERFPHIPLIHLVRDGRDVAASLMKRGFNLYFAGTRWLYDTLCGLNARGSKNYLEITYENMVHNPDDVLKKIFNLVGVNPEEYYKKITGPKAWNQTPADPISTASIGRYKKRFSEKELSTLYRIKLTEKSRENINSDIKTFGELIEHLGYDSSTINFSHADVGQRLQEKYLELQDYFRRLNRYKNNGRYTYPIRYSKIT